ncbi:MAG: ABC transporter substrate-binding protein [Spirochaetales bacterium]|nr:ABC transporter substrate-binding protein [Spirochaetales bacterium]
MLSLLFSQELTILTENSGMANRLDEEGKLVGYATEIVREILQRHGEPDNIQVYPWARAYKRLGEEPNIALFSTTRTAQREDLFKWVGPLIMIDWAFYKRIDNDVTINSLEEAKKQKGIVVIQQDAKEKFLLDNGFTNVYSVNNDTSCILMLDNGRVDLWVTSSRGIVSASGHAGLDPGDFVNAFTIKEVYLYIAFSMGTPDRIVNKWQATLDEMKRDGSYERIMMENGGESVMVLSSD